MSDSLADATVQSPDPGVRSMSRLADRIAGLAPALDLATVAKQIDPPDFPSRPPMPRPSPVVMAALARTDAMTGRAALQAQQPRRRRSLVSWLIGGFVGACSFIPYALVALALRLVMARVFFLDGQTRIDGVRLPLDVQGLDLSVVVPLQVRAETFATFFTQYAALPLPPVLAAYLVSAAEFVLPVMLVLGLGARFAALGLLIMTAMIQFYVLPQALWSTHIYWASMLMVLLALGPGRFSLDALIRAVSRR